MLQRKGEENTHKAFLLNMAMRFIHWVIDTMLAK